MDKYEVLIQETRTVVYEVEAEDEEDARWNYERGDITYEKKQSFEVQKVEVLPTEQIRDK